MTRYCLDCAAEREVKPRTCCTCGFDHEACTECGSDQLRVKPAKVWIVTYTDDDDESHVAAVCDNEATARKYPSTIYSVEEYEVQS